MRARVLITLVYAIVLGVWAYGEKKGASPVLSPPGISMFIWFGLLLLLGVWLGNVWERRRGRKVPTGRYG